MWRFAQRRGVADTYRERARSVTGDRRHPHERRRRFDEVVPWVVLRRFHALVSAPAGESLHRDVSGTEHPAWRGLADRHRAFTIRPWPHTNVIARDQHLHFRDSPARARR